MNTESDIIFDSDSLADFVSDVLVEEGLSVEHADIVADNLLDANLRGIDSHGIVRLNAYVERLRNGGIRSEPDVTFTSHGQSQSTGIVDADGGPGQVAALRGMKEAVELGAQFGGSFVGIRNSNHFGTASYYTNYAAEHGCIGICMTHSGPNMAPFGGSNPYFGTNPISFSVPTDREYPISVDMATSVTAKGNVILAEDRDESIPEQWAIDESGEPTTDPSEFHALRPMAGPKGYGLAFIIDVLCGTLLDTVQGQDVPTMYDDMSEPQGLGHFLGVIDIESFTDAERFTERVGATIDELNQMDPADGHDQVLVPGQLEMRARKRRRQDGIPVDESIVTELHQLADDNRLNLPVRSRE